MNKLNNPQISAKVNFIDKIEINSDDSKNNKFSSERMLENILADDCVNEEFYKNELDNNNNVTTVRIKKENLMTHSINFDEAKETIKSKQKKDYTSSDINDKKTAIDNNYENSNFGKTGNLTEEVKIIEEHFINTNRDFKPILYDEDLNAKLEEEKLKQNEFKQNLPNKIENKLKQDNEIINKFLNNNFENNMFQNQVEKVKEEDNNNDKEEINFKETIYKNTNNNENEYNKTENKYNNTLNVDEQIKDTHLAGNYRNENYANTDDIMIVSFIEDKMKLDRKGIFYGMNKIYLFINKRSGSQEGKTMLEIVSKHHKNFEIKGSDINLFNELYQNINIIKIITKQGDSKSKEIQDIYVFVIDLLDNDKKQSGIESLRIDSSQGKMKFK